MKRERGSEITQNSDQLGVSKAEPTVGHGMCSQGNSSNTERKTGQENEEGEVTKIFHKLSQVTSGFHSQIANIDSKYAK